MELGKYRAEWLLRQTLETGLANFKSRDRKWRNIFVSFKNSFPPFFSRTHTIILVDKGNNVEFFEWTLEPNDNGVTSEREWRFTKQEFKLIE